MSVVVSFYFNKSENNKLDKDLEEVGISAQDVVFKATTSIMTPTLSFRYSNESSVPRYFKCNYIRIGAPVNRYYFVDDITTVAQGIIELKCHIDVLMTYSTYIRQQTAVINRQENQWNLYLDDGSFKVYQNPMVQTKLFPDGFTTQQFVLAVAGA